MASLYDKIFLLLTRSLYLSDSFIKSILSIRSRADFSPSKQDDIIRKIDTISRDMLAIEITEEHNRSLKMITIESINIIKMQIENIPA